MQGDGIEQTVSGKVGRDWRRSAGRAVRLRPQLIEADWFSVGFR